MSKLYLKFACTGQLNSMTREELKKFLFKKNHKLTETIDNSVDFLICNEKVSNSSKFKEAVKFGIGIIDEDDLFEMLKFE